jgi:hypothetical protein
MFDVDQAKARLSACRLPDLPPMSSVGWEEQAVLEREALRLVIDELRALVVEADPVDVYEISPLLTTGMGFGAVRVLEEETALALARVLVGTPYGTAIVQRFDRVARKVTLLGTFAVGYPGRRRRDGNAGNLSAGALDTG